MTPVLLVALGIIYLLLCLLIVLIVMIQPSKSGGGMGGLGGGAAAGAISESLGATQAEKQLAQWTYWMMGAFFVLALTLTALGNMVSGARVNLVEELPATTTVIPDASLPSTPAASTTPAPTAS